MMFTNVFANSMMMNTAASAHQAEASSCVSCSANNSIALILDAMIVASIFVISLIALISIIFILALNINLLILALLVVLLALAYPYTPKT